jgi:hypothetical protein
MGDIYKFGCEYCGYKTKDLHIGVGMMGPEYDWSAAPCFKCNTVKTINVAQEEVRCKRCKTELELYDFYGEKSKDLEDSVLLGRASRYKVGGYVLQTYQTITI